MSLNKQANDSTQPCSKAESEVEPANDKSDAVDTFEQDLAQAIRMSLEKTRTESVCPVCDRGLDLDPRETEVHVNQCLDAMSAVTTEMSASSSGGTSNSSSSVMIKTTTATTTIADTRRTTQPTLHIQSHNSLKRLTSTTAAEPITDEEQSTSSDSTKKKPRKLCPEHKRVKDTPFVVDAFSYGSVDHCDGYFLTHYHSDHYGGLTRGWTHGPIYCSQVTANLVQQKLKVDPQYIVPLPMDTLCTVGNVTVGLIDANHCPGSVLFLFSTETSKGKQVRHLHTGDFRAAPRMCLHPLIRQPDNPPIDCLYLDTTYMSPNYAFPPQQECIQAACDLAEAHVKIEREANLPSGLDRWLSTSVIKTKKKAHRLLVVVGTYLVGKERVFIEVAKQLGSKIYVTSTKKELLLCQENPELEAMITEDQHEAQVHVIPMNHIKKENLQAYLNSMDPHFTSVIGIRPTGWTFTDKKYTSPLVIPLQQGSSNVAIYGVPYSEHSSFKELESFVMSLEIRHIIPTVHLEPLKLEEMEEIYSDWQRQKSKGTPKVVCYPSIDYW